MRRKPSINSKLEQARPPVFLMFLSQTTKGTPGELIFIQITLLMSSGTKNTKIYHKKIGFSPSQQSLGASRTGCEHDFSKNSTHQSSSETHSKRLQRFQVLMITVIDCDRAFVFRSTNQYSVIGSIFDKIFPLIRTLFYPAKWKSNTRKPLLQI